METASRVFATMKAIKEMFLYFKKDDRIFIFKTNLPIEIEWVLENFWGTERKTESEKFWMFSLRELSKILQERIGKLRLFCSSCWDVGSYIEHLTEGDSYQQNCYLENQEIHQG